MRVFGCTVILWEAAWIRSLVFTDVLHNLELSCLCSTVHYGSLLFAKCLKIFGI